MTLNQQLALGRRRAKSTKIRPGDTCDTNWYTSLENGQPNFDDHRYCFNPAVKKILFIGAAQSTAFCAEHLAEYEARNRRELGL